MKTADLLHQIVESRNGIAQLCKHLSQERLDAIADELTGWSIKTLIAHLTFWERATLYVRSGFASAQSLRNVPAINAELLSRTRSRSAKEVLQEFQNSGKRLIDEIKNFTDEELLKESPWGDGKTLSEHLLDDTVVHYEEHKGKLVKWLAGKAGAPFG